jgi:hypothetical protein
MSTQTTPTNSQRYVYQQGGYIFRRTPDVNNSTAVGFIDMTHTATGRMSWAFNKYLTHDQGQWPNSKRTVLNINDKDQAIKAALVICELENL